MAKRGELKPMDAFEEDVRQNAVHYNITLFIPGSSTRLKESKPTLDEAIAESKVLLQDNARARSAMVYAVNEDERFAMVGSVDRSGKWKPVVAKRY